MFDHSVKVASLYKVAAKIARTVNEGGGSLKNLLYQQRHINLKALYALVATCLQNTKQLDYLFKKSQLLEKENRLDPWLARILITELLWGTRRLEGSSKPVKTILSYQQILNALFSDIHEDQQKINKVAKPRFVRVNTLLISVNEVIEGFRDEGWTFVRFMDTTDYDGFRSRVANLGPEEFMVDIHISELLIFPPKTQFHRHNAYRNGSIILQDKASCLPVHLLNPTPGSTVLDMCAAPGMKSSHIAAKMDNKGIIYAVDHDRKRLQTLDQLMERSNITCVQSIFNDVLRVTNADCPDVEYILVDPSCSGTGIVDRQDLTNTNIDNEFRLKKLSGFQIMILKHALRGFPQAKRVVYSTCSLNAQENEFVVKDVISQCSSFKLLPATTSFKSNWHNFGGEEFGEIGRRCIYTKPDEDLTNGFFVAVFERLEDGEENEFLNENIDYGENRKRYFKDKNENGYKSNKDQEKYENQESLENFFKRENEHLEVEIPKKKKKSMTDSKAVDTLNEVHSKKSKKNKKNKRDKIEESIVEFQESKVNESKKKIKNEDLAEKGLEEPAQNKEKKKKRKRLVEKSESDIQSTNGYPDLVCEIVEKRTAKDLMNIKSNADSLTQDGTEQIQKRIKKREILVETIEEPRKTDENQPKKIKKKKNKSKDIFEESVKIGHENTEKENKSSKDNQDLVNGTVEKKKKKNHKKDRIETKENAKDIPTQGHDEQDNKKIEKKPKHVEGIQELKDSDENLLKEHKKKRKNKSKDVVEKDLFELNRENKSDKLKRKRKERVVDALEAVSGEEKMHKKKKSKKDHEI